MIPPDEPRVAHINVHRALSRYLEWAQDGVAVALGVVLLVVMAQSLWMLGVLAFVQGREPRIVLSQVVLVLILVELYRTLLFYLREHRVSVGLMVEVAIVSLLCELLRVIGAGVAFENQTLALQHQTQAANAPIHAALQMRFEAIDLREVDQQGARLVR